MEHDNMRKTVSSLSLLPAILMTGIYAAAAQEDAQRQEAVSLTVSLVTPTKVRWPDTVPASGWLKPWHEATISSEVGGLRITDVLADVGTLVKKGDVLARLDQAGALADLAKQEAALVTAQANLTKAKTDANRARDIGAGAISDQKKAEYFNAEETATASVASEKATLDAQRIKLGQTVIYAVDDGMITSRSASLGAVVSSGTELFRLIRQQRIEWQAEVSALNLRHIRSGQVTEIDTPGADTVKGTVRLVSPTVSDETGRAIVYVELPKEPPPRSGLYVSGRIDISASDALTVPETALAYRDGLTYLFIVDDAHKAHRVLVQVGRRRAERVEISSGLSSVQQVVQAGGAFLSENASVKVTEAGK
jgi:RND family efflux transporter MFP subunit